MCSFKVSVPACGSHRRVDAASTGVFFLSFKKVECGHSRTCPCASLEKKTHPVHENTTSFSISSFLPAGGQIWVIFPIGEYERQLLRHIVLLLLSFLITCMHNLSLRLASIMTGGWSFPLRNNTHSGPQRLWRRGVDEVPLRVWGWGKKKKKKSNDDHYQMITATVNFPGGQQMALNAAEMFPGGPHQTRHSWHAAVVRKWTCNDESIWNNNGAHKGQKQESNVYCRLFTKGE